MTARPFLKWAGGKRQLLPEILPRIPDSFGRYFEPFVGGGAVFFAMASEGLAVGSVLGDLNLELVTTYQAVRSYPKSLIRALSGLKFDPETFDRLRKLRPGDDDSEEEVAARMIYLNRTCFNGLYRVNKSGEFNVPIGAFKTPPTICDEENLTACSKALQPADVRHGSFLETLEDVERGDFVYCDPPYLPVYKNFTAYTRGGFGLEDHTKLADTLRRLDAKGTKWLLSNSDHPGVLKLYEGFHVERMSARRNINSAGGKRGPVTELLIRNYR